MIKNVLSVLAGFVAGYLVFYIFETIGRAFSPEPTGFDAATMSYTKAVLDGMPVYAWLIVVFGYAVGSFGGGYITGRFTTEKTHIFTLILSVFFILGWLIQIVTIPHPLWVVAAVFLIFVPCAMVGHKLALGNLSKEKD